MVKTRHVCGRTGLMTPGGLAPHPQMPCLRGVLESAVKHVEGALFCVAEIALSEHAEHEVKRPGFHLLLLYRPCRELCVRFLRFS